MAGKEISASDLTAFTSSLLQVLAQTREAILDSSRAGEVASRPDFGLAGFPLCQDSCRTD